MPHATSPSIIERIHGAYVFNRRVWVLSERLAGLLPRGARILDVGCGDGLIDSLILRRRPDLEITGCDILVRPETHIPVRPFDGRTLPFEDDSYEVVQLVDVLHHTNNPAILLAEAVRVACQLVVIKDHTADGLLAHSTLRFMDQVGNARHGVNLPYNYLTSRQWETIMDGLGLRPVFTSNRLRLYPAFANWWFGRGLHFLGSFAVPGRPDAPTPDASPAGGDASQG